MKGKTLHCIVCILLTVIVIFYKTVPSKGERSPSVPLTRVNVGFSGTAGTQAVVWYAFEKGLFQKYHLDVNLVSLEGASTAAMALIAGDMDFCQMAGPAVVNAVVAGEDLVIIAINGPSPACVPIIPKLYFDPLAKSGWLEVGES